MKSQISELNLLMKETEVSAKPVCMFLCAHLENVFLHRTLRVADELGIQGLVGFHPCFSGIRKTHLRMKFQCVIHA